MLDALRRGAIAGAGYALVVVAAECWLMVYQTTFSGLPPMTWALVRIALLEILFGALLGGIFSPLLAVRGGRFWHLIAVAALWAGLSYYVALSRTAVGVWLLWPLVGVLAVVCGRWLARWKPVLPGVLGALAVGSAMVTPALHEALTAAPAEAPVSLPAAREGAPDVVLIVLDTVRTKSMSTYGYERSTSPVFEALAEESALFLDASAPSTWSLPSHASLFTGLYPSGHGAHSEHRFLGKQAPTLAEGLAGAGYDTRVFTANAWISDTLGLTRGFAWSDEAWRTSDVERGFAFIYRLLDHLGFAAEDKGGGNVAANFEEWVKGRPEGGRPAFVFLNFLEAHFPYHQLPDYYLRRFTSMPMSELAGYSARLLGANFLGPLDAATTRAITEPAIAMYDAGVLYSDYLLGRVVETLEQAGTLDDTILVVLSDHGELLGEWGDFGHGFSVHEPVMRVPLLVRYPPRVSANTRVATPVSTLGVYATVLDLAGVEMPAPVHYGSLLPSIQGGAAAGPIMIERFAVNTGADRGHPLLDPTIRLRAYRSGTDKLVETSEGDIYLFDLATDPDEEHDLAKSAPADAARLKDELDTWCAALGLPAIDAAIDAAEAPEMDPGARERLRALGYIE